MSHPKFDIFRKAVEKLGGNPPPPGWSENLIKDLIQAGATHQDLREISEQIKRGFGRHRGLV